LFVVGLLAVLSGCSTTAGGPTTTTSQTPLPAGAHPSSIARQVCQREAVKDIDSALGVAASVSTPTWVDHRYTCDYRYPTGSMALSVQELSSWGQTDAYYRALATQYGKARSLPGLGQGAFQTTNGSVVVRKDWKVLLVDIRGLPGQFGVPPTSAGDVAVTVGDVILGCWAGD
jgi:hypothetical protein